MCELSGKYLGVIGKYPRASKYFTMCEVEAYETL
jgi:hypothetical protein